MKSEAFLSNDFLRQLEGNFLKEQPVDNSHNCPNSSAIAAPTLRAKGKNEHLTMVSANATNSHLSNCSMFCYIDTLLVTYKTQLHKAPIDNSWQFHFTYKIDQCLAMK